MELSILGSLEIFKCSGSPLRWTQFPRDKIAHVTRMRNVLWLSFDSGSTLGMFTNALLLISVSRCFCVCHRFDCRKLVPWKKVRQRSVRQNDSTVSVWRFWSTLRFSSCSSSSNTLFWFEHSKGLSNGGLGIWNRWWSGLFTSFLVSISYQDLAVDMLQAEEKNVKLSRDWREVILKYYENRAINSHQWSC